MEETMRRTKVDFGEKNSNSKHSWFWRSLRPLKTDTLSFFIEFLKKKKIQNK